MPALQGHQNMRLAQDIGCPLTSEQIISLPYFSVFAPHCTPKQLYRLAELASKIFRLMNFEKGKIIYLPGQPATHGYLLLQGKVQILHRKRGLQRQQNPPGHVAFQLSKKLDFLHNTFGISRESGAALVDQLYEEQIFFKFRHFRSLYAEGDFGFGEMVHNTQRGEMAVTTQASKLLVIDKLKFDQHFREFQINKKERILKAFFKNIRPEVTAETKYKATQMISTSGIINKEKGEVIFREGDCPEGIYLILGGQVEIRKNLVLEVPGKNENKAIRSKKLQVKIAKICQEAVLGDDTILLGMTEYMTTAVVTNSNTLLVKISLSSYLKFLMESSNYERQIISQTKLKFSLAMKSYHRQSEAFTREFLAQNQQIEALKQERALSNIMQNQKNLDTFEVFNQQGVFYRDTFEKLEGFDRFKSAELSSNNITGSPNKPLNKVQSSVQMTTTPQKKETKSLVSIRKATKASEERRAKNYHKPLPQFKKLERDNLVFRKVLIQTGAYPKKREIDKDNIKKSIIHPRFDQIINMCVTHQSLSSIISSRRCWLGQYEGNTVKEAFRKSVCSIRELPSSTKFIEPTFITCRGTEQMKKKLKEHKLANRIRLQREQLQRPSHAKQKKRAKQGEQELLAIGLSNPQRHPQKSKQTQQRQSYSMTHPNFKVVLLNHMMKPVGYTNIK